MESYGYSYQARKLDALTLLDLPANHKVAAFHLGGVAVECFLKSLLFIYHEITSWDEPSNRVKDAMYKQAVKNPSHSLVEALRHMPSLYKKAKCDVHFLKHLANILHPLGATSLDYINLRYVAVTDCASDDWRKSFQYVCGWLEKNRKLI